MLLFPLFGYRFIRPFYPIKVTLRPHYFRHNYVTMLYESGMRSYEETMRLYQSLR